MATPATVSIEPTLAAIRARWCINSSKTTQSFNDPASMEEVVEYLKEHTQLFASLSHAPN